MGYSIIFETKVVKLSNGKYLHLDLSGCNNDDCGRDRHEFNGKIYTYDDYIKHANGFKENSKSMKESENFDMKIGSKYVTMYDYGEHLLRMMKRSITFDELVSERSFFGTVYDGVELLENDVKSTLNPEEWDKICYDFMYGKRKGYAKRLTHTIKTEDDVIQSLENGERVEFYVGKKYKS